MWKYSIINTLVIRMLFTCGCVFRFGFLSCKTKNKIIASTKSTNKIMFLTLSHSMHKVRCVSKGDEGRVWYQKIKCILRNPSASCRSSHQHCMFSGACGWFMPGSWNYKDTSHAAGSGSFTPQLSLELRADYQQRWLMLFVCTNQIS